MTAAKSPLICGSAEKGGLTQQECTDFDAALATLKEAPNACKKPLWSPSTETPGFTDLNVPWRLYAVAQVNFVAFNGCSATVMQNFAALHYGIDGLHRKHPYDTVGCPRLDKFDLEKFREYILLKLFHTRIVGTPLFLNLPPVGDYYASCRKFLAKHDAEVACEFVNPNYPSRAITKQYTTLYVFNHHKWMNPGQPPRFTGLIK